MAITERHIGDDTYTHCDMCASPVVTEVEDALEMPNGSWIKAAPRRGCGNHPVGEPLVIFKDGNKVTFSAYKKSTEQVN